MARLFHGRFTAGSFHARDEEPQLGILVGCEEGWMLQLLLLSLTQQGRDRHFGHLPLPALILNPSGHPGNVCPGCDGCRLAQGDNSGRRVKGGTGRQVPVVGSAGMSWVLLLKTSPLLFPTVFMALPGHPCQGRALPGIPWHRALASSWRVSPAVPAWGQAAASEGSGAAGPVCVPACPGVQSSGSPRVNLPSSLPGSKITLCPCLGF